jgi:hypothetical protein
VQPVRAAYRKLVELLGIDAIVLVDGGTDILMHGDEAGLGTPEEDMASLGALDQAGAYLGALSIPRQSPEGAAYLDAVEHAARHTPIHPSIVNGHIAAAMRGEFGDRHFTTRTGGSELLINPLMAMYFSFDLMGVYRRLLYRAQIENTESARPSTCDTTARSRTEAAAPVSPARASAKPGTGAAHPARNRPRSPDPPP